jgi:MFS family permease
LDYLAIAAIVMQMVSIYTPVLCLSRLLMGIFCGFTTGIVPSYIVSIAPSFASGIIGSYSQMSIVLGMAFAYYMGQFLDNTTFSDQTALRFFIGLPIVCLIVHLVTLHLFPFDNIERLIYKRDNATVRRYLKFVYGKNWKSFESEIREHKILPVEVAEAPKDDDEE